MGKFNFTNTIEYTFANYNEFINDIVDEYNSGKDIEIAVTWEQVPEIIRDVLNKTEVVSYDIQFAYPEITGYNKEYFIDLYHGILGDKGALFVEQAFNDDLGKYLSVENDNNTIAFISQDVNISLYEKYDEENFNIVLFDIESDR